MSGHSKWATTKHQKAAKDKVRGKLFAKLIRQVEVAAREGGGDMSANATLRTMVDKARDASVPLDTIERAIEPGAVAWQFHRKGMIIVDKTTGVDEDELMMAALEAGAEDVTDQGDTFDITTAPTDFTSVRDALGKAGIAMASADLTMIATTAVPLTTEADARKVLRVLDALEEHDDVQNVYANFDIPDEIFQAVSAE